MRRLGPVLGRRVLVTGASGGVGRFAVQLAARAGAHVIASVGSPERAEGLQALGAGEILAGTAKPAEPVFGVLDNVGGNLLAEVFGALEDGGIALSIGWASCEPTILDFEEERMKGVLKRLEPFTESSSGTYGTSGSAVAVSGCWYIWPRFPAFRWTDRRSGELGRGLCAFLGLIAAADSWRVSGGGCGL
ncbi:zinc-binding dehydrogenase [Nonomuraea angiospora]|uniref:NADPH:quinone reductase-like Zn-dependent oxidoreductase n=1 Tax=Nonomuraea angiospora TaxID=46172 RepID=A0ABR9M4I7_9ACTN|nr:zinc-binding dehydrogenase [Nonomuraea angiospora]MBE1587826.1 NADPH:quinone reductase-like Zn-dependent oxidoreductase [Nonomuraea angiospora]